MEGLEIKITHDRDSVYATCDTLPGFYVSDRDEASVLAVVPEAIRVWHSADEHIPSSTKKIRDGIALMRGR